MDSDEDEPYIPSGIARRVVNSHQPIKKPQVEEDDDDEPYIPSGVAKRVVSSPSPMKKQEESHESVDYSLEFDSDNDDPSKGISPLKLSKIKKNNKNNNIPRFAADEQEQIPDSVVGFQVPEPEPPIKSIKKKFSLLPSSRESRIDTGDTNNKFSLLPSSRESRIDTGDTNNKFSLLPSSRESRTDTGDKTLRSNNNHDQKEMEDMQMQWGLDYAEKREEDVTDNDTDNVKSTTNLTEELFGKSKFKSNENENENKIYAVADSGINDPNDPMDNEEEGEAQGEGDDEDTPHMNGMDLEAYLMNSNIGDDNTNQEPDPSLKGLEGMSPTSSSQKRYDNTGMELDSDKLEEATNVLENSGDDEMYNSNDFEDNDDDSLSHTNNSNRMKLDKKEKKVGLRERMRKEIQNEIGFDILDDFQEEPVNYHKNKANVVKKKKKKVKGGSKNVGFNEESPYLEKENMNNKKSKGYKSSGGVTDINSFIDKHSFEKVSAIRQQIMKNTPPSNEKRKGYTSSKSSSNNNSPSLPSIGSKEHLAHLLNQVGNIQEQLKTLHGKDSRGSNEGALDGHYFDKDEEEEDEDDRMARINSVIAGVRGQDTEKPSKTKSKNNSSSSTTGTSSISSYYVSKASSPQSKVRALEEHVSSLKRDLKRRDERLQRMSDQNLSLTSQCENFKREVYYLQSTLKEKDGELEIKEQKILDATKAKKRALSKANKMASALEDLDNLQESLADSRNREGVLMESIEVLSRQNEELSIELNKALNREIKFREMQAEMLEAEAAQRRQTKQNQRSPERMSKLDEQTSTKGSRYMRDRERIEGNKSMPLQASNSNGKSNNKGRNKPNNNRRKVASSKENGLPDLHY